MKLSSILPAALFALACTAADVREARAAVPAQTMQVTGWASFHGTIEPQWVSAAESEAFYRWVLTFQNRPLDWVLTCYPWGEEGPLDNRLPEDWQIRWLRTLQELLMEKAEPVTASEKLNLVVKMTVATGHGVGKTALVAWIIHWFVSTHPNPQAVITASTDTQLQTKTWRELSKWQTLAINGWMFEWTATRYKFKAKPETWYASAIPWSEHNSAAFAGTHEKYVLMLFDEASGIAPKIWEVAEGGMTSGKCLFLVFGNPTENSGGFHDTHHKLAHRWTGFRVDSRTVSFTNKQELANWIEDHGLDSDFCRIRITGEFPKQAASQFIGHDVVSKARQRVIDWKDVPRSTPRLMGVDVARQGDDSSAIVLRQGRKVHKDITRFQIPDLMRVAAYVAQKIREYQPDVVFVDATGMGQGVSDRLRELGFTNIIDVISGEACPLERDRKRVVNMRMLMWERVRDWLPAADLPDDPLLAEDLTGPEFFFERRTQRMQLEAKQDMKGRGLRSPDAGDALACTFYDLVPTKSNAGRSAEPAVS